MKAKAMKFREKKFRTFYRIYILPMVIPSRKGTVKKAMQEELEGHWEDVKENGLQAELETYLDGQKGRQIAYDNMQKLKSEARQNPSEAAGEAALKARIHFIEVKAAFAKAYE